MLAELVARPYCLFRRCNKICLNYQCLRCPLTGSFGSVEYIGAEEKPSSDCGLVGWSGPI